MISLSGVQDFVIFKYTKTPQLRQFLAQIGQ